MGQLLSRDEFYARNARQLLRVGESYEEMARLASLIKGIYRERDSKSVLRTVLGGDSMTSQHNADNAATTATYDSSTGILTFNKVGHAMPPDAIVDIYHSNRSYTSLRKSVRRSVTRVSADVLTVQLPVGLSDLPNGALSGGTLFFREDNNIPTNSWVMWLNALLGQPFNIVNNAAQSGDTSAEFLAKLDDYVFAYEPDVVLMQSAGINDLASNISAETTWANIEETCRRIVDNNILLIIGSVTPCRTPETARTGKTNGGRVAEWHRRLVALGRSLGGMIVLPNYDSIVDITNANGEAKTGVLKTDDGVHYQPKGAVDVAVRAAAILTNQFPGIVQHRLRATIQGHHGSALSVSGITIANGIATASITGHSFRVGERVRILGASPAGLNKRHVVLTAPTDQITFATEVTGTVTGTITASLSNSLIPNAGFATTSGGIVATNLTGAAPASFRAGNLSAVNITGAASVIDDPDGEGKLCRLALTAVAAGEYPAVRTDPTTLMATYLRPGGKYYAICKVKLSCADWPSNPLQTLTLRVTLIVDGNTYNIHSGRENFAGGAVDAGMFTADGTYYLRTPVFIVPQGSLTTCYVAAYIRPLTGGIVSLVNFDVGQFDLVEVED